MNGLPTNFDSTIFLGKELIQISFSANTAHFSFSDDVRITILSTLIYRLTKSDPDRSESIPVTSSAVMGLLGQVVSSAVATSDGTLLLTFTNGGSLKCIDDSEEYESYHLQLGSREVIV
jgi:uncharacterized protein DUF6188